MKIIRKILFYLNIALVALTLLAYLSPYVNPSIIWFLSILGLVVPLLFLLNLLFIFFWLISDWKKSWLSILTLLIGANYLTQTISFSSSSDKSDFTIATYNMHFAYGAFKNGTYRYDKEKSAIFSGFLKKEINTDILCAQESNKHIINLIGDHYPYQYAPKNTGTSIFSRFPILHSGSIDFGTITNSCVWTDLILEKDTIRVYSAHLRSNSISMNTDRVIRDAENQQKVDMEQINTIFGKYKKYVAIRSHQANLVRQHMEKSPYPVILAGDFNDPPVSYTHRILSSEKLDAFSVAGAGLGRTYAGKIPLLRIDNIIVDKFFSVKSYQTLFKKYSDHYPVKVGIDLPEG